MSAHGKQRDQHQRQMIKGKTYGRDNHDRDFAQLDQANQAILGVLFTELTRQRRKQEERHYKEQRTQIDPDPAITLDVQLIKDGQDQRLLEQVVIERTQGLGHEEGQEATFA